MIYYSFIVSLVVGRHKNEFCLQTLKQIKAEFGKGLCRVTDLSCHAM